MSGPRITPGGVRELGTEIGPKVDGIPGELLIGGHIHAFALQPDQPHVGVRGAQVAIGAIQQQHIQPGARQSIGEGRSDQPGSNHHHIGAHVDSRCIWRR